MIDDLGVVAETVVEWSADETFCVSNRHSRMVEAG
jgi:hypothetical protein